MEWKTLEGISKLITKGTTPKRYTNNGISFIKTEAFDGSIIVRKKLSFIDEDTHQKELKRSILQENDILITIAGATIGKCAIVPRELLPANTNQALAIIRLNNSIVIKYIFHLLKSGLMKSYIESNSKGSAQPNLNLKQLNDFLIPVPSIEEQERIVRLLDQYDEATKNIVAQLEKEIELRNKQYEYYRNSLLNFLKN
ncbi:restriction endonuclease subunit S [Myroides ceti]|uniref:Restriction endonuclease subunit S n=1 Tax=Paenimyroides ceti TaxID=395087 RepID=A0ABT8D3D2_9FLAO|nr:restriction endonuclease subunit S [Paenimyroides ceti]MDN3709749.1 restriction endonuclease subunit S [Paenimyroides ceti]